MTEAIDRAVLTEVRAHGARSRKQVVTVVAEALGDPEAVHDRITALLAAGVLQRSSFGGLTLGSGGKR